MAGPNKVKRYKRIYSNGAEQRRRKIRWGILAVACLVLAFVGYNLIEPISDFFSGNMNYTISESPSSLISSVAPVDEPEEPASSAPPETAASDSLAAQKSLYAPPAMVKDPALFSAFLETAKQKGYTAILFDAKDKMGNVLYQSADPLVARAKAQTPDAYSMEERLAAIKAAGLTPLVRLAAFEDNIASRILENSFVMFREDQNFRWIDNAEGQGGRGWLSPESEMAQAYISGIAGELAAKGCTTIFVTSLQYPSGLGLNLSYSGPRSETDKFGVLGEYAKTLRDQLLTQNSNLVLEVGALSLIGGDANLYGGNPLDFGLPALAPTIFPDQIPAPLTLGAVQIPGPKDAPYDTTSLILTTIQTAATGKTNLIYPLYQSFGGYEGGAVNEQIRASTDLQVGGFCLFSDQGIYP